MFIVYESYVAHNDKNKYKMKKLYNEDKTLEKMVISESLFIVTYDIFILF